MCSYVCMPLGRHSCPLYICCQAMSTSQSIKEKCKQFVENQAKEVEAVQKENVSAQQNCPSILSRPPVYHGFSARLSDQIGTSCTIYMQLCFSFTCGQCIFCIHFRDAFHINSSAKTICTWLDTAKYCISVPMEKERGYKARRTLAYPFQLLQLANGVCLKKSFVNQLRNHC